MQYTVIYNNGKSKIEQIIKYPQDEFDVSFSIVSKRIETLPNETFEEALLRFNISSFLFIFEGWPKGWANNISNEEIEKCL